jgi:hypothetical protein
MHPRGSNPDALFAHALDRLLDAFERIDVRARRLLRDHRYSPASNDIARGVEEWKNRYALLRG